MAPAPTGGRFVDAALVALAIGITTWLGGTASPPVLVALGAGVGALALDRPLVAAAALVAAVFVAVTSFRRRTSVESSTVAAGLIGLGALHLPEIGGFGGSAIAAAIVFVVLAVAGLRPRSRRTKRIVGYGAVFAVELAVIFSGLAAGAMVRSRHQLASATDDVRLALRTLDDGDVDGARALFERAGEQLADGASRLDALWTKPGLLVPVVAQHQRAAADLADGAADLVAVANGTLARIDPGTARLTGGRFDVSAIDAMAPPLAELVVATDRFDRRLTRSRSEWLAAPVTERLDELEAELDENLPRLRTMSRSVSAASVLLGTDESQRYFVAFVTPSEARPGGGHLGNFAELTIDAGQLELSKVGRTRELLDRSADPAARVITGPPEYLERYGIFGAGGGGAPAKPEWWQLVTISPDFPSVAQVMAELYPLTGAEPVDGVISIDPSGLAALLRITGPVSVGEPPTVLSADNVVNYLQRDQYALVDAIGNEERGELLGEAARAAFAQLLVTPDIDPVVFLRTLGDAVASGHLRMWSGDPFVQSVFESVGAAGSFELDAPSDALAVTQLNSGGNKLDAFLDRRITYTAAFDSSTGAITAQARVELTNTAPSSGLPDYVIGSVIGDPTGTNRSYVTLYTPHEVTGVSVDGVAVTPSDAAAGTELGWNFVEWEVIIPSGATVVVEYELAGSLPTSVPYSLEWVQQPLSKADGFTATVTTDDGSALVAVATTTDRTTTFRPVDP